MTQHARRRWHKSRNCKYKRIALLAIYQIKSLIDIALWIQILGWKMYFNHWAFSMRYFFQQKISAVLFLVVNVRYRLIKWKFCSNCTNCTLPWNFFIMLKSFCKISTSIWNYLTIHLHLEFIWLIQIIFWNHNFLICDKNYPLFNTSMK